VPQKKIKAAVYHSPLPRQKKNVLHRHILPLRNKRKRHKIKDDTKRKSFRKNVEQKRNDDRKTQNDNAIMDTAKFAQALYCITEVLQVFGNLVQALGVTLGGFDTVAEARFKEGHSLQWDGLKQKRLKVRDQACLFAESISVRVKESKVIIETATEIDDLTDLISFVNADQINKNLTALIGECNALLQEFRLILGQEDVWDNYARYAAGLLICTAALVSIVQPMLVPLIPTAVVSSGAYMVYLRHTKKQLKELQQQLNKDKETCLLMTKHLQSTRIYSGPLLDARRKVKNILANRLDSVYSACKRILANVHSSQI